MDKTWIIVLAISIFILTTIVYLRITNKHFKKIYGHNRKWGARMFYWQDAIYICTGVTFLILVIIKYTNIMTF